MLSLIFFALIATIATAEISYVMEPFEEISDRWNTDVFNDQGKLDLSMTEPGLFGGRALRVEYQATQSENWGGFVGFGWILNASEPAHNCLGATHVSFWYNVLKPQSLEGRVHLRLMIFDDSHCAVGEDCFRDRGYETYYTFQHVLDNDESIGWQEVRVELRGDENSDSPFWRPGWSGIVGNNELDLDHLKGWNFEMSIDSQAGMGNYSEGVFLIDQLSCVGGGELLGAPFRANETFENAVEEGAWFAQYPSSFSENMSEILFVDGMLEVNYTLGMDEFLGLQHLAPGAAYYNLSTAANVSLGYEVVEMPDSGGNLYLRMMLMDGSDCEIDCALYPGVNLESYQASPHVLTQNDTVRSDNLSVALHDEHGKSLSSLLQTRAAGASGGNVLDISKIKGYRFEIYIDSAAGNVAESFVSGVIAIGNMTTVTQPINISGYDTTGIINNIPRCINEPDVMFEADLFPEKMEFLGTQKCCETCLADPNCLYAYSTIKDCHMAPNAQPESVELVNTDFLQETVTAFWMDDVTKRGDFCQICECRESDRVIDCRGRDLIIVPKTFSPKSFEASAVWEPRVLDLRENPQLTVLGTNALESIASSIEELRLPNNLRHLALDTVRSLPLLNLVDFEGSQRWEGEGNSEHRIQNVITEPSGFFGDICCDRGSQIDLLSPQQGLTFCDMKVDTAGADGHYEPFLQYYLPSKIDELIPSSKFMAEAAESPEKCAQYCAISNECKYFSYDARQNQAEHTCYLLYNKGIRSDTVCCDPDDYADGDQTIPGWTSGYPPRTRNEFDNARVLSEAKDLVIDETNGYRTQFVLSLGSMPLRGAVWIEPRLMSTTNLNVSISPRRVVLYDDKMVATINVTVSNIDDIVMGDTLVVTSSIQACDAAFTMSQETVYISVIMPSGKPRITIAVATMLAFVVVGLFVLYFYMERKKKQADLAWRIKTSEVTFKVPREIIGRGTFGPVLLGEYHGTRVAVKRIFPAGTSERNSTKGQKDKDFQNSVATENLNIFQSTNDSQSDDFSVSSVSDIESAPEMKSSERLNLPEQFARAAPPTRSGRDGVKMVFGCHRNDLVTRKADFLTDMRHLSKLRHPCIATVMGAIMDTEVGPTLVMEYMHYGSLYDLLRNETVDHREYILSMLCDITQGMRFLHATKPQVIHGDLKAQNILVDSRFRAKVTDFGLSHKKKHLAESGAKSYWMAPELLREECEETTQSDAYAFGVTLFEVYSCKDPYEGEEYGLVMRQLMDPMVKKLPLLPSTCPKTIKSIMEKCLDNCPEKRPSFRSLDMQLKSMEEENDRQSSLQAKKADSILYEVFPRHIAEALRDGRKVEPESHEIVTIFFSDIVGFTDISGTLSPMKVSDMLDRLYHRFDMLSASHDVFKVETIGDAYMAVTNLVKDQPDHTKRIADFSIDALKAANETLIDANDPSKGHVKIRVGFHSGPVVANVVGSRNVRYCLFGDTVNTASRMESSSMENRIHCSALSSKLLRKQDPNMKILKRGVIDVKGKGKMLTYWINEGTLDC